MVESIAKVNFQDIENNIPISTKTIIIFLATTTKFPLTALLADARSFVILEMISPFL